MTVVSGLHDFLADDVELAQAAARHGGQLVDLRRNDEHDVANRRGIRQGCLRIHTVGNDCSVGKMVAAVELARGLARAGVDAAFVATGQTGILVAGGGCPVDRVIGDFISGAAEKLVLANQQHEVIVVEGQGSLFHPRYSGVTLGLLHGLMPHGLILCYEMGRTAVAGMEDVPLPPLGKVVEFYEAAANLMHPCRVIGVAVNGQNIPATRTLPPSAPRRARVGPAGLRCASSRPGQAGAGGGGVAAGIGDARIKNGRVCCVRCRVGRAQRAPPKGWPKS